MPEDKILTGYPSIDKPWLKYYSKEAINAPLPQMTMYEYVWENNKSRLDSIAIEYFGNRITYQSLFDSIEKAAKAFVAAGIQTGDVVVIASVTLPEIIYAIYALNRIGAIANMVDPRTSTEGIRDYIQEVAARLVLTIDVAYSKLLHAAEGTSVKDIVTLNAADSMPPLLRTAIKLKACTGKMTDSASI